MVARLLRVEPTKSHLTGEPDGYGWHVFDNGRSLHRSLERAPPPARSSTPAIRRDSIAPCLGMDGQTHDSLSSYRRTLRADGNPQGENYIELGNESLSPVIYDFDKAERRDHIRAALQDVKNGNVPPLTVLEDFHV